MAKQALIKTIDAPHAPGHRDRRAWVRYACHQEVLCQQESRSSAQAWPARVQNVSLGGLALMLHHRLREGMVLSVAVQTPDDCTRVFLVRIVRLEVLTAHPGLRWLAGCEFVEPVTAAELAGLLP